MSACVREANKSTELAAIVLFRRARISGWRRHVAWLPGTPDFVFAKHRLAVFIDGCYWHGCKTCPRNIRADLQRSLLAREGAKQSQARPSGFALLRTKAGVLFASGSTSYPGTHWYAHIVFQTP